MNEPLTPEEPFQGFIDTEEDFDWLDDDSGDKLRAIEKAVEDNGYLPVPVDMPVPDQEDRYDFFFYGPLAYYKPKGEGAS